MGVFVILFMVLCVILYIRSFLKTSKFREFANKVGGPRGLPLIGVLHRLLSMRDILYILPTLATNCNSKAAFIWIGPEPYFYTFDPEVAEKILSSRNCTDKTKAFEVMDKELGPGLLSSKTARWIKHRKLLSPSFHHKVLLKFFPIFNVNSNQLMTKLDNLVGCGEIDLNDMFQKFTMQTALATTMDVEVNEANEKDAAFISHVQNYLKISIDRTLILWMKIDLLFYWHKFYNSYMESRKYIYSFTTDLINKKLEKIGKIETSKLNEDAVDIIKSRRIFMDQAIELYRTNQFSWKDIFIESNTLVLAAFETSASTLYSVLMLLAMHPQYQEKLFEEVLSVFPEKEVNVNNDDLANLVYMNMIINETLRVAATIPLLGREASGGDIKISDDISIPQGTSILIDIFNLHRDKDIWGPNATKFNPDNFLPENQVGKHPYAFIPFSKGPRNCIGWRYAEMFLKIILSKIVRNYWFTTSFPFEDLKFTMNMSLRFDVIPGIEIHRR